MTRPIALACASVSALALAACQAPTESAKDESAATSEIDAAAHRDILPATARPTSYEISVTPDFAEFTFDGEATLVFEVLEPTERIVVNGLGLEVTAAQLDGSPVQAKVDENAQRIEFIAEAPIALGRHDITVSYTGKIYEQSAGLFHVEYPVDGEMQMMLATQFEPGDARRLAPMWDEPALKAKFKLSVVVPSDLDVVSNTPIETESDAGNGLKRVQFGQTPMMSSYLLFLGAGDLSRISRTDYGVEHGVVTKAGDAEKARFALEASADLIGYFNDYFGVEYPLAKLDHIAVPGAGGFGAMENWGAIMYFERALLLDPKLSTPGDKRRVFGVVAHETAHQWFGDLVTMAWWNDLWLNEGFASWMASKSTDHFHPEWKPWVRAAASREYAMSLDSFASTHPIVQPIRDIEEANLAFDAITYLKGRAVIRMIEAYVGEDAFREGVRAYMRDHAYANTVNADLWRAVEAASDAPVLDIARDFTTQPGVPLIEVADIACDTESNVSIVTLSQRRFAADAASRAEARVWNTPVTAAVVENGEFSKATIAGPEPQTMELNGCGAVKINAGESAYFRTDYPDNAFEALETSWAALGAADQIGLINDAYALGETGDAPFSRYFELVGNIRPEADSLILSTMASNFGALNRVYEGRPAYDAFSAFARARLTPVLERIGWNRTEGESDNVASLRADLLRVLSDLGDQSVIDEARRRFANFEEDPDSIGSDILRTIIFIVAGNADEEMFDKLRLRAKNASSPLEQRLYLFALTSVKDETLAARALELALTDEVPTQLRARLISNVGEVHPKLAWDFYMQRREEIDALLDPLSRLDYPAGILRDATKAALADKLETYAKNNLPESAQAATARTVDRIRNRAEVREKRLPELDAWLAEHAG